MGSKLKEFLHIMNHVDKKECPICRLKVPRCRAICPNCGYNPPIAGGFLTKEDFELLFK